MTTIAEQIEALEKEIRETPYDKSTERHHGMLRARIARLKEKQIESQAKGGGGGGGYAVKKQGDATVVLVGPPSVGKSTLINALTNAQSKVAPYAFTTLTVIPGMMRYNDAYIQILDVPGIIKGAEEGKGRGREVLSVVRGCDLIIIITDPKNIDAFETITAALERNGIRLNQTPPDVSIDKKMQGGVNTQSNIKQDIPENTVKDIAREFGVKSGDVTIREKLTMDRLIDAFSSNRVYVKCMKVLNKVDQQKSSHLDRSSHVYLPISAEYGLGLSELKDAIWRELDLVKVYLVEPFKDPDFESPVIMHHNTTLRDVAEDIGQEFAQTKKSAKIWNTGAKFPGQEVSLSTKILEGMQVRFL